MARPSNPLIVSAEDLEELNSLLSHTEPKMRDRIRIIIACANEPSNKKVSQELNIDEHTVAKWKEAYRISGIDGLRSAHGGGRKAKKSFDNLEELVLKKVNDPNQKWTIHSLAESIGCSDYQISSIIKSKGIALTRKHSWTYETLDTVRSSDVEIVGIYLAVDVCIVIASYSHYGLVTEPGIMEVLDRGFWERLNRSTIQVSLPNAIIEHGNYPSGNVPVISYHRYLKDFFSNMKELPDLSYQVFVWPGTCFHHDEKPHPNVTITTYDDMEEWEHQIHSWLGARTTGIRLYELEALQKVIRSYVEKISGSRKSFCWKKLVIHTGTQEQRIDFAPYEEPMGWDASEEGFNQFASLLSEDGKIKSGLIAFVADDKRVVCKTIETSDLAQPDQFDFSSKEGLMNGLNKIEAPIIRLRDQAGIAITEMYFDKVKKN